MNSMRPLQIAPGLELIDLALFLPERRVLAMADVHLGLEDALHAEGVFVPRQHAAQVQQRLERILRALRLSPSAPLNRLIINGDLRHQFGPLSRVESKEAQDFLNWLAPWTKQIVLIAGNHDGSLAQFASPQLIIAQSYEDANCWIVHGDELLDIPSEAEWVVIGHEHPAVGLRDPVTERLEVYKCFLLGKFEDKKLLVLPSCNQLIRGSDLTKEQALSPFVRASRLEDFFVYPVSDEGLVYEFGPLRRLLVPV